MKRSKTQQILCIDPGLKDLGYAVLADGALVLAGVKGLSLLPRPERPREALRWVRYLLDTIRPSTVVIEKTNGQQKGPFAGLHDLGEATKAIARRLGIPSVVYPAQTVRKCLAGSGWASKAELARVVAGRLPALRPFLSQDRRWKERYFSNLFDAVALGLYHHLHRMTPSRSHSCG